jgi:predicted acetyltransferase
MTPSAGGEETEQVDGAVSVEIRPIRDDEVEQFAFVDAYAFNQDRRPEAIEEAAAFARATYPLEWSLAAFADGRMAAGLRVLPFAMRINGGTVAMGGVTGVACLPEHRRRGHVGALLQRSLADMRDRGQVLSGLYTPHYPLYRRYGWEVASTAVRYSFAPKDVQVVRPPGEERCRRVTADEWPTLEAIYEEYARGRNGPLVRAEVWWREAVFGGKRRPHDAALWEGVGGEGRGYVVYRTRRFDVSDRPFPQNVLRVRELIALDGEAYAGLVSYLLHHDLDERIEWFASLDEPLLSVLIDPWRVRMEAWPGLMLRMVDVPRALGERPCLEQAQGRRLVLAVRDGSAPWNEGVWRLEVDDGRLFVQASSEQPDLSLDARTLAGLYNGHLAPAEAARVGVLEVGRPSALDEAAAIFSVSCAPYCIDEF